MLIKAQNKFISILLIQILSIFILSACGGGGGGSSNESPTLADASFNIPENAANGAGVGTIAGNDSDGDPLNYSIVQVTTTGTAAKAAPEGTFAIGLTSGQITVANKSAFSPLPTEPLTITVQVADDSGETATATVSITITDVNVVPAGILANPNLSIANIAANGAPVGDPLGSANDGLAFSIIGGNTGNAFAIDPVTGQITVNDATAINTGDSFQLEVQVTDGTLTNTVVIGVTVDDVTIVPAGFNPSVGIDGADISNGALVGGPLGTATDGLTFSIVGGNDNGAFTIDPETGQISVADSSAINLGETVNLVIQITDGTLTETVTIAIAVSDFVDPTLINPTTPISVNDTAQNGDTVAGPFGTVGDGLTFSITGGNDSGAFTINPDTGEVTVNDSTALGEGPFELTIQVTNGSITDTFTITIGVNDINEAPSLADTTRSINETASNGTNVGAALTGTDPENDALTYKITAGDSEQAFEIKTTASGQITIKDNTALTVGETVLTVEVSDGKLKSTAKVTVTVIDVIQPVISGPITNTILNRAAEGTKLGTIGVTLGDATAITSRTLNVKGSNTPSPVFLINDKNEVVRTDGGTLVGGDTHTLEAIYSSDAGKSKALPVTIEVRNDFKGDRAKVLAFGNSLTEGEGYTNCDFSDPLKRDANCDPVSVDAVTGLPVRTVQPDAVLPLNADGLSYRHQMFGSQGVTAISPNGVDVEIIGTRESDWISRVTDVFARHDGHSGADSNDIRDELPALKSSGLLTEADIVLITLGTNDVLQEAIGIGRQTEINLTDIINQMRNENPNLVFVLGRIYPLDVTNSTIFDFGKTDPGQVSTKAELAATLTAANTHVADKNTAIDNVAAALSTATSPVITADMNAVFTIAKETVNKTLLSDGIHPNALGERVMAEKWVEALDQFFDGEDDSNPVNK